MKKLLIASGCSFTDENFISALHPEMDCSWPKWPELLAKKLDMDYINLGANGGGNEYIYFSILEEILKIKDKSKIGLVIPAWSQSQRQDFQQNRIPVWKRKRFYSDGDIFAWVRKSMWYMLSLQMICERYNIPFKQFQMISLFDGWISGLSKTDAEKWENRNNPNFKDRYTYPGYNKDVDRKLCLDIILEYEPYINVENFIGWPIHNLLGGFHIEEKTLRYKGRNHPDDYILDLLVSNLDVHPNAKGQEKITEFLYDRLG
tara:strand:+ start:108 stop:887 length:780 start_codon:yes stop_codon:yes gene_type:complete